MQQLTDLFAEHKPLLLLAGASLLGTYLLAKFLIPSRRRWSSPLTRARLASLGVSAGEEASSVLVVSLGRYDEGDRHSGSPFCAKVEAFLRVAGIPYRIVPQGHSLVGPTGKWPWIQYRGEVVADSSEIVARLTEIFDVRMDRELGARERALGTVLQKTVEEHLYFVTVWTRWNSGWKETNKRFFSSIPFPISLILPAYIRSQVLKNLKAQGIGRQSPEQIQAAGERVISSLAALLPAGRDFFLGDRLSSYDIAIATQLKAASETVFDDGSRTFASAFAAAPALVAFLERVEKLSLPDAYP